MSLSEKLMEELVSRTAFTIPLFGGIPVQDSVVVTWGIMAFVILLCLIFVRNLKLVPTRKQACIETAVGGVYRFFHGILGDEGKGYIPYLATVGIYLGLSNLSGLVGLTPPTKDINVTAGLAVMSIVLIEYSGIRKKGFKGFIKSFAEPVPFIAPLNVLEVFIRPLSLCMRLFGNILGGFVIMELLKIVAPILVPIPFSFYFDVFDGLIQMYVFVFLTAIFMKELMD